MKTFPIVLLLVLVGCEDGMYSDTALLEADDAEDVARQAQAPIAATPVVATHQRLDSDLAVLTVSTDSGDDGTIDRVQETTFDSGGKRILLREDRDGDGEFELVTAYAYVWDQGQLIRVETDEGADGSVDTVETREYTTTGRIWRTITDEGADGVADRIDEHVWDANGHRVQMSMDKPAGGVVETIQEFRFGNDDIVDGRLMSRYNDDGLIQSVRYNNVYLPNGLLGTMGIDLQDDGKVDNRIERVYDADGRMIGTLTDNGADGTIDTLHSYIYSDEGRLVELAIDMGNDGTFDNVIYRDYHNFKPVAMGCQ